MRRKALISLTAFVVVVSGGCSRPPAPVSTPSLPPVVDQTVVDDAAVYKAVLEGETAIGSSYVVVDTTGSDREDSRKFNKLQWEPFQKVNGVSSSHAGDFHPALTIEGYQWDELAQSFKIRNAKSDSLVHFATSRKLTWVKSVDLDMVFKHGFWDAFHKQYPGNDGVVTFSEPGYSKDKNYAIVFFTSARGGKDGEGDYFLLMRTNTGQWRYLWSHMTGIS